MALALIVAFLSGLRAAMEAGLFLHVVAIVLLFIFLGGVIVGIVAAAILFNLRRDRQSPPFRMPRKEDDRSLGPLQETSPRARETSHMSALVDH